MKKQVLLFVIVLCFLLLQIVSAINIEVEKQAVNEVVIPELDNSAIFDFTIKNNGAADNFEIYSLLDIDFSPKGTFYISSGETKEIRLEVKPGESVKKNEGYYNFAYKIRGSTGTKEERLMIRIVKIEDAINLWTDEINPYSEKTKVYVENKERFDFPEMEAEFSSAFFEFKETFSLKSLETKSFEIKLDKEKIKGLVAGMYILEANIKINNTQERLEGTIDFLEKPGISTQESAKGIFIRRHEIEKKNDGNTKTLVIIAISKNWLERIFTNFDTPYYKKEGSTYFWQRELNPGESLKVVATTNWLILILLIVAIVVIIILSRIYLVSDLILKKRITHVKTKGGEFALKVTILAKARRYIERVSVIDKLPPMLKLYERYGTIAPDRIDEKNRRVEWNIESLNEREEAIFSYIVYSKIGVVGRFSLPSATAVYERNGKVKEASSNRVFFLSEPRRKKRE